MKRGKHWGQAARIVREFAELREKQEQERKRKDARREVRATLKRIAERVK